MHRRLSGLERRLARIAGRLRGWAAEAAAARALQRTRRVVAAAIRDGLERARLDPDAAAGLRRYEALAQEPPLPPPRLVPLADRPRDALLARIAALAERLRGDPPALATAAPIALFAYYCLGEGARPKAVMGTARDGG